MPKLKSLTVIVFALLLPSCAVYLHDDHHYRHGYAGAPCDHPPQQISRPQEEPQIATRAGA